MQALTLPAPDGTVSTRRLGESSPPKNGASIRVRLSAVADPAECERGRRVTEKMVGSFAQHVGRLNDRERSASDLAFDSGAVERQAKTPGLRLKAHGARRRQRACVVPLRARRVARSGILGFRFAAGPGRGAVVARRGQRRICRFRVCMKFFEITSLLGEHDGKCRFRRCVSDRLPYRGGAMLRRLFRSLHGRRAVRTPRPAPTEGV